MHFSLCSAQLCDGELRDDWLLNFNLEQSGQTEPVSGLEAGQTGAGQERLADVLKTDCSGV